MSTPALLLLLAMYAVPEAGGDWQPPGAGELQAMPGARAENPVFRVGQMFWVQPKTRPFSVDFYDSPALDTRIELAQTRRFVVVGMVPTDEGEPMYQVRFESGQDAFIPVTRFEAELYVEPDPFSRTPVESSLYLSPQAYFYSLKSIFSEDPGVLWERIRHLGPTRIRVLPKTPQAPESGGKPKGKDGRGTGPEPDPRQGARQK